MIGKKIRMERIINRETGKTVIVPMDHGVTLGPVAGLIDLQETVNAVADGTPVTFTVDLGSMLHGTDYRPIPDRIEAGTLAVQVMVQAPLSPFHA